MSAKKRCNTLTLKSKIDLIKYHDEGKVNVKLLMERFECGKTQVYEILKNKDKIKEKWLDGNYSSATRRKPRKTGNENINEILYRWFLEARALNVPISGPVLKEQAKLIAHRFGKVDFKASNGWLESFRSRHEISFKTVDEDDAKDVDLGAVDDWKMELEELIKGYDPRNVGNCDETELFFKALPSENYRYVGERQQPQERITVLLCGFADGTIEKLLVLGKSLKPRCFKNLNVHELPVTWRANKTARMTSMLMKEWLQCLNYKMKAENRNILLFLDNADCHPRLEFSNIKLAFFPPKTTNLTQPMNQGIIKNMKMHYRKLLLQSLCANITTSTSVTELSKKISVLDAIRWVSCATNKIKRDCVTACFEQAGFHFKNDTDGDEFVKKEINSQQDMQDIQILIEELEENSITAENYVEIDETAASERGYQTFDDFLKISLHENEEENDNEDEGQGLAMNIEENEKINTFTDALKKLSALEDFARRVNCMEMTEKLLNLRTVMEENAPRKIKNEITLPES